MKIKVEVFNSLKFSLIICFLLFIILLDSCNSENPSFQWFHDKTIGVRICEMKMQNNQIVIKVNILNKSGSSFELDNPGSDFDGLMYMFLDEETNKRHQSKETVASQWKM